MRWRRGSTLASRSSTRACAGRLRELAFRAALRDFLAEERGEAVDLLAAYGVDRVRAMLEQVYGELRSRGERLPRLPPARARPPREEDRSDAEDAPEDAHANAALDDADAVRACALLDELLHRFGDAYERLKHGRGAVDFDDLELLAGALLLEREDVRSAWSDRFELLMVDEFQDTNHRQLGILAALDRGNLFTVGDELQSIYGFRHADVSLFRARRGQLEELGGSLRLSRNFRSREALLEVVNAVFAERFAGYAPLVAGRDAPAPGRHEGDLGPAEDPAAQGEPDVELLLTDVRGWEQREDLGGPIAAGLPHAQLWRQAEARMLAQRVAELVAEGRARAGEVVVLLRAAGDLEVFERALQLLRPSHPGGRGRLLGAPADRRPDLLSARARQSTRRARAVLGAGLAAGGLLARSPGADRGCRPRGSTRGMGDGARGGRRRGRRGEPWHRRWGGWPRFATRVRRSRRARVLLRAPATRARGGPAADALGADRAGDRRRAATASTCSGSTGPSGDSRTSTSCCAWRVDSKRARDATCAASSTTSRTSRKRSKVEPDAPVEGVEPDAVRLMTIHAAKGLEFPVVCLADLGRQPNTQTPDMLVDGERVGLRLMRLDGARSTPALDYEQLCEERRAREAEEEDRILYVAMTRARERLLLSGAVDFERWPASRQAPTPISWLVPALSADLPALVADLPALAETTQASVFDLPIGAGSASVRCRLNTPATVGSVLRLPAVESVEGPASVESVEGPASARASSPSRRSLRRSRSRANSSPSRCSRWARARRRRQAR